jgi:1,4-dihydroxy-2-naphthoyl-CoA hydrolase
MQPGTLSGVLGRTQGHMGDRVGLEVLEATVERVVGRMPVEGNTQPYGLLHGGEGRYVVGVDINATHHRGATEGWVTGVATPLFLGRSAATYAIAITRDDGKLVCSARITCLLKDA